MHAYLGPCGSVTRAIQPAIELRLLRGGAAARRESAPRLTACLSGESPLVRRESPIMKELRGEDVPAGGDVAGLSGP